MARGTLRVRIIGDASNLQRVLGRAGGNLGKFAARASAALGVAVVGGVTASVRAFANFDQAMTNSTAIMGDLSSSMRDDMAAAAREVATTTKFSATEAAESYFFLASAGMDAAASIEALPKVAAFAQAGNFDMARATDLATDAQSALGLAADDTAENIANLGRVQDVFVKANTLANASVEEFAESMTNKAGAALQSVNKDIEEGVAVLAVFADQGIKGSEAGTLLRNTLTGLSENARDNAGAFEDLGVAVFDSEGEMRNMGDIVADLEVGLEGMSTEQREATLAQLGFNQRQRDGILALLGNSDALADYEESLRDAGGTTQEVADNQMDTFWAQLGLVKDMLIEIGLTIGEWLMPHLMTFVEWVQEHLPDIARVVNELLDAFTFLFTGVRESAEGTKEDISGVRDSWDSDFGKMEEVTDSWARSLDTDAENTRASFAEVSDWIENTLIPAFEDIRDWWDRNGDDIVAAVKGIGTAFVGMVQAVAAAVDWYTDQLDRMSAHGEETGRKLGSAWALFRLDLMRFQRRAALHIEAFQITVDLMADAVQERIDGVAEWFERLPGRVARALPFSRWAQIGAQIASGIAQGVTDTASAIVNAVQRAVSRALSAAKSVLGISSPSKVYAEELGAPMGEGVVEGLRRQAEAVERAKLDMLGVPSVEVPSLSGWTMSAVGSGLRDSSRSSEDRRDESLAMIEHHLSQLRKASERQAREPLVTALNRDERLTG